MNRQRICPQVSEAAPGMGSASPSGWYCDYIYDVADEEEDPDHIDLFTCELCDCSQVRSVHVMRHDEHFETVAVGCICAGIMEAISSPPESVSGL